MKSILTNNNFITLYGNIISAGSNLLIIMLLARKFSGEELGMWMLFLSAFNLLDILRTGLIKTALVKFFLVDKLNKESVIGSAWVIGILFTAFVSVIVFLLNHFFRDAFVRNNYVYFLDWYSVLAFANLPYVFSGWFQQAKSNFISLLVLKLIIVVPLLIFVVFYYFSSIVLHDLIKFYVLVHLVASIIVMALNWSGINYIFRATKKQITDQLNFGKFSIGTVVGSNLLRNSDVFIINAFLGPTFVAMYSVPLKFIELIEVPVRSFGVTLFPKLSKLSNNFNYTDVARVFNGYAGLVTIGLIPVYVFSFVFAEELVFFLGGDKYVEYSNVFRIFIIYGFLLPVDRYIGIALDSVGLPRYNMYKIFSMVLFNIVADILVLYYFKNIYLVAAVTIGTVSVGVYFGMKFLNKRVSTSLVEVYSQGGEDIKETLKEKKLGSVFT